MPHRLLCLLLLLANTATAAELPEGFKLTTFAKPPQISYPTGLAVAATGEVYVSVDLNSSLDTEPNRGSIVKCVDTDNDGVADVFTHFVPNIDSPRGMCFVGDTLYVVHPPFLSAFRDHNQDGVADEHDTLITGMGFDLTFRGADHTSNGVRMGIDGWLYLAIGDYGMYKAVAKDGSTMHLHGGGVLRVRPDGSKLQMHTANTRNIVDVAVSPTLDVFTRDNTNDGKGWNTRFHHAIALADMGYPRLYKNFAAEHLPALADFGGGSGTAGYYLDEPGFPESFNDKAYTGDFTTNKVYYHPMTAAHGTFKTGQEIFFTRKAIDMDADGASAIYIADWEGGGYRFDNPNVGSISRITYPALPANTFPNLIKASDAQLLKAIISSSAVTRINAQAEILKRGVNPAFSKGLAQQAANTSIHLYPRIAALFTLKRLDGANANPAITKLTQDATIRSYALRALADNPDQLANVSATPFLNALNDSDPRTQLQAIIGLAKLGDATHAKAILPLAVPSTNADPTRLAIPHVAAKAIIRLGATRACLDALTNPALQSAALRCLNEMHNADAVAGLIATLKTSNDNTLRIGVMKTLFRLYNTEKPWDGKVWWTTRPDDRGPYFEPVQWDSTSEIGQAIGRAFASFNAKDAQDLYVQLQRNRIDPAQLDLGDVQLDEALVTINQPTVGSWAIGLLAEAAQDDKRPTDIRIKAFSRLIEIIGLESFNAQLDILAQWRATDPDNADFKRVFTEFVYSTRYAGNYKILRFNKSSNDQTQIKSMMVLNLAHSPLSNDTVKQVMTKTIRSNMKNPAMIRAIGEMGRGEYTQQVKDAVKSKDNKLVKAGTLALKQLQQNEQTLGALASQMVGALSADEAQSILMKTHGDKQLGEQLFARQGCIACHALSQDEPQKGPYLGAVGGKFDRPYMIQAILEPSKVVAQGFQTQTLTLKDGTQLIGFITGDANGILELRDIAGVVTQIDKTQIKTQTMLPISMMPPGLGAALSVHELASLIDFLQSLH